MSTETTITPEIRRWLMQELRFPVMATIGKSGMPSLSVIWFDLDPERDDVVLLNTLAGRSRDTRLFTIYGYARLVVYDRSLKIVADLLESYEVQEGRIFTFKLRKGHKWSDGAPFTSVPRATASPPAELGAAADTT